METMLASNFLEEVLARADTATLDHFREAVATITEKVSSLKSELILALEKSFGTLDLDINRVSSWFLEITGVDEETSKLLDRLNSQKFAQTVSSEELIFVQEELSVCDNNIHLLKDMVEVVQTLEIAEPADIFVAAKWLRKAKDSLKSVIKDFHEFDFKRIDWVRGLQSAITERIDETYEFAMIEWETKFQFQHNTLVFDPELGKGDIPRLIDALKCLNYYPKQCERFCVEIWQELLSKACTPDFTIKVTFPNLKNSKKPMLVAQKDIPVRDTDPESPLEPDQETAVPFGSHNAVLIHAKRLDSPITEISGVFKNIIRLLEQLSEIFEDRIEIMRDFSEILGPKVISVLSTKCLKSLILQASKGCRQTARESILQLHDFKEKLAEMNFVIPEEHESLLDEFESNFDTLFMRQVREDNLASVRTLIQSNLHHTIQIFPDDASFYMDSNTDELILQRNPYEHQAYTISRSISDMVEILQEYSAKYPQDQLLISHAFNMFIGIVNIPKHQADVKDFIPLSAVLIHNNCMFLAHNAETVFPLCEDHIPLLRTKATQAFTFMMKSIRTHLNGMISEAMTGLDVESETSTSKREHQFLSIAFEFAKLNGIFKEVLPAGPWREALGALVDHTLNEICSKVLVCEDISATTGNDLADAFTKLAVETSTVFLREGLSSRELEGVTAKLVPKWNRFRLLTFVLTATMREIGDKWVNGCGPLSMVFSADEVRKLVRALFQNTEHRAAFLASIK